VTRTTLLALALGPAMSAAAAGAAPPPPPATSASWGSRCLR